MTVLLLGIAPAAAQGGGRVPDAAAPAHPTAASLRAVKAGGTMVLDGRLDEPAWAAAPPAVDFTQTDPAEGRPASERTEVRVVYDREMLYVGARMFDSGKVSSRLGRRDTSLGDSDWFTVILDTYHDHLTALRFQVNPSGVRSDAALSSDRSGDGSWDAVWEVATSVDPEGWVAEIRIPLGQLRFSREEVQTWGVQFARTISRKQETAVFAFTPKRERGGIARYGHLVGLEGLRPGRQLELLPYATARSEHRIVPRGSPFRDGSDQFGGMGLDAKYRVTSNLTLDGTFNPDFGQVELDPAQVNLTAFETFYQEKRPFFVEGANIFNFAGGGGFANGTRLLYSRRIGARPGSLGISGAVYSDVPEATTILGAAKLTGKTRNGWSVGFLDALTSQETARFIDTAAVQHDASVEPLTNFFVGRLRKELRAGQTTLGGMVTAVNRDLNTPVLERGLRSSAYVGGTDFRHEWARRSWAVTMSAAVSRVAGSRQVITGVQGSSVRYFQRPDADHLVLDTASTSLAGYALNAAVAKEAGRHWTGGLQVNAVSPGYEINDLGFQSWADRRALQAHVQYTEKEPGKILRQWYASPGSRTEWNSGGDRLTTSLYLSAFGQLRSYWSGDLFLRRSFGGLNDRLTRGGPLTREVTSNLVDGTVDSDPRKRVTLSGYASYAWDDAGSWRGSLSPSVAFKPAPNWNVSVGPNAEWSHSTAQYVTRRSDPTATHTFGTRYLFSALDQTILGLSTRLNVTASPSLSLELYAQPYISRGDYLDLKELAASRSFRFSRYGTDIGTFSRDRVAPGLFNVDPDGAGPARGFQFADRDFNYLSLRGNAVLRWEWRRGSTLFVGWQQQRSDYIDASRVDPLTNPAGRFRLGRDVENLFGLRPENVFLVKVNYWLNP